MKLLVTLLLTVSFSFGAFAETASPTAIEIRPISIGTGIDHDVLSGIFGHLGLDKISGKIRFIVQSQWGREGEFTSCVQFRDPQTTAIRFQEITKIVAASEEDPRLTAVTLKNVCDLKGL